MKNKTAQPFPALLLFWIFFTPCASMAQSALPAASVVINEPTRLNAAEIKKANPGKDLPQGHSIAIANKKTKKIETKDETANPVRVFTGPCAEGAITCIEIVSNAGQSQHQVPVTFGQPFKMGDWKHREKGLAAKDNLGYAVPLQVDQISSHQDGSARFAVLSTQLKDLAPKERRVLSIFVGQKSEKPALFTEKSLPAHKLEATIYHPQRTRVQFGNRVGHTPGIAFAAGEKISVVLDGPVTERYSLVVNAEQAGGSHITLTRIADAFIELINSQSKYFQVEKSYGTYENLWVTAKDSNAGAFQASVEYQGPAKFQIVNERTFAKPETWIAQSNIKDTSDSSADSPNVLRLQGKVVSEFPQKLAFRNAVTGAEHPHLVARLDSRIYHESGAVWTDFILENNWTFKKDPNNIRYKLSIQENGKVVYQEPVFDHYSHARWHKALWSGTAPGIEVRHHMPYFMASGAVWNYDLGLHVPERVLDAEAALLQKKVSEQAALGPMKNVMLETTFPGPGGRWEIAPLPRWTALYLVTQDPRAHASMMANTDASAAVPVHYRDEKTDQPVEPINYPALTVYGGTGNIPYTTDRNIWFPDTAHQGSFSYTPYLLTGQRFYLDEMLFWANWNIFSFPADYRVKEKALIYNQQLRGQAWVLRSLAEADRSLADSHFMKSSFRNLLKNNMDWYKTNYLEEGKGSPLGFIEATKTQVSTWQNDFFVTILALMAENKEPSAKDLHSWFSRFSVGRFLADGEGFCAARASGYYWITAGDDGKPFTKWSEFFKKNHPEDAGKPCTDLVVTGGYPDLPGGYSAYARGMLGASANAGYADAARAYLKWKALTPKMDAAFQEDPSWAIVPRK